MKRLLQVICCLLLLASSLVAATNSLDWRHNENRVDADISTWTLDQLLEQISAASGWEVLVEPGAEHEVSVKFKGLTIERALPRLLGKLNYALLPQTNAPPRFCVYQTSVGKATRVVRHTIKAADDDSSDAIPNELVITLDPSSSLTIEQLAEMLGAKIVGRVDGLRTYLLRFEDADAANAAREKLAQNPDVAQVDSNYMMDPPVNALTAPGSALPFNLKATAVGDPNNLIIGLIDSRVQELDPAMQAFLLPGIEVVGSASPAKDLTHGTSMAQTLLQGLMAGTQGNGVSNVKILPVDVYGDRATTSTFDVAAGIVQAVNNGAMTINLSLGSSGNSLFLQKVIQDCVQQGVTFFAAAGNIPTDSPTYPAAYPEVTAVTAGDRNKNLAPYANYGSFVDLIGPGGSIVKYGGQTHYVGGTSVATAFMTGMAVGAADASGKPITEVQSAILQNFGFQPPAKK